MQNIEEIYIQYSKQIYKYLFCLTHSKNIAEELTQETFYIAIKEVKKFRGDCKLYVWLCQIAKHLYYKELKKNKKIATISLEVLKKDIQAQNNSMENTCIHKLDIYQRIDALDERTREIMYLRLEGNLSFKEIGEILKISENLARVSFYRGKQKIKEGDFYEEK